MKNESYLPKGFHYLSREAFQVKNSILEIFSRLSYNLFTELVEFPPVSFYRTFEKGADTIGEKVYYFNDKKERKLILTPDAQAHIYNYHINNNEYDRNKRYSWLSPTFRYRNILSRHFYQIGYSSINYCKENEVIELFLCTRQLINLCKQTTSAHIKITVYNPALILDIIYQILNDWSQTALFYEKIRNLGPELSIGVIEDAFSASKHKDHLLKLFSCKYNDVNSLYSLSEYDQCTCTLNFLSLFSGIKNIAFKIELQTLYCSEILSGIGFTFEINDHKIGDGGIYSSYASKFNSKIKTAISACTGVNAITKHYNNYQNYYCVTILLKNYTSDILNCLNISEGLSDMGFLTNVQPMTKTKRDSTPKGSWLLQLEQAERNAFDGNVSNQELSEYHTFKKQTCKEIVNIIKNLSIIKSNEF